VKLSVRSDYATRAVLGLARHFPSGAPMTVERLAAEQEVPPKFLVQILIELKSQNIVKSLRGKEGGYLLARAPAEITLGDVLRCVHGEVFGVDAVTNRGCPPELQGAWRRLQENLDATADGITFQELLDESTERGKVYDI
jgi:Rrf2 family transcriptional regulator, cysteine metabolism repressor